MLVLIYHVNSLKCKNAIIVFVGKNSLYQKLDTPALKRLIVCYITLVIIIIIHGKVKSKTKRIFPRGEFLKEYWYVASTGALIL